MLDRKGVGNGRWICTLAGFLILLFSLDTTGTRGHESVSAIADRSISSGERHQGCLRLASDIIKMMAFERHGIFEHLGVASLALPPLATRMSCQPGQRFGVYVLHEKRNETGHESHHILSCLILFSGQEVTNSHRRKIKGPRALINAPFFFSLPENQPTGYGCPLGVRPFLSRPHNSGCQNADSSAVEGEGINSNHGDSPGPLPLT